MNDITDGIKDVIGHVADGNHDDGAAFDIFELGINGMARLFDDGLGCGPIRRRGRWSGLALDSTAGLGFELRQAKQ